MGVVWNQEVDRDWIYFKCAGESLNYLKLSRNLDFEDAATEGSNRSEEHVIGAGGKRIPITKWQKV